MRQRLNDPTKEVIEWASLQLDGPVRRPRRRDGDEDDGYFYASIAYHAGVDGLFSFDGIHRTDGFHMLWGYMLAGGSFLLSTVTRSRSAHLYLACVISAAVSALVANRFGRRSQDRLLIFGLGLMGTLLMETPLLTLLVLTVAAELKASRVLGRLGRGVVWPSTYMGRNLLLVLLLGTLVVHPPRARPGPGWPWAGWGSRPSSSARLAPAHGTRRRPARSKTSCTTCSGSSLPERRSIRSTDRDTSASSRNVRLSTETVW